MVIKHKSEEYILNNRQYSTFNCFTKVVFQRIRLNSFTWVSVGFYRLSMLIWYWWIFRSTFKKGFLSFNFQITHTHEYIYIYIYLNDIIDVKGIFFYLHTCFSLETDNYRTPHPHCDVGCGNGPSLQRCARVKPKLPFPSEYSRKYFFMC